MILRIDKVTKQYANHKALDQVSLEVPKGCILGLLGPNGAGKTSLIRIITQITAADEGEVFFENEKLASKHIGKIGYLPEERGLYKKMQVGEQLMYLAQLKGLTAKDAKERLKDWFHRMDIRDWWTKNVEDLSKGMQQKVQFIATVLHQPELIILDEPFTGFDPVNAGIIKDEILKLKQSGCTIIFSTHRMESVEELCDHIVLIHKSKKILDGKKSEIKKQHRTHTYLLETDSEFGINHHFDVVGSETQEGIVKTQVKLLNGSINELLQTIMPQTNLIGFREIVPSMNDIFINLVKN